MRSQVDKDFTLSWLLKLDKNLSYLKLTVLKKTKTLAVIFKVSTLPYLWDTRLLHECSFYQLKSWLTVQARLPIQRAEAYQNQKLASEIWMPADSNLSLLSV